MAWSVGHCVQVWQVLPAFAKPGRYRLRVQHAFGGDRGSFYLTAWTDRDGDGAPDTEIGRSPVAAARRPGDWCEWEFRAPSDSIFVGYCWAKGKEQVIYYQQGGRAPPGYVGLGGTLFYATVYGNPPTRRASPRYTNIRLNLIGEPEQ